MQWSRVLLVSFLLAALASQAHAAVTRQRVAPDPLPAWSSLRPAVVNARITRTDQLIGQFWNFNGHLLFVWDIAFAKMPGGRVIMLRGEFQGADGTHEMTDDVSLADLPRGTKPFDLLEDVLPGGPEEIFWLDGDGKVLTLSRAQLRAMGTSLEEVPTLGDPNERCTPHFTAHCLTTGCTGTCKLSPAVCGCDGSTGNCVVTIDTMACSGTCPMGTCLLASEGGCDCVT